MKLFGKSIGKVLGTPAAVLGLFLSTALCSAASTPPSINGFVDTSYVYNFNKPVNGVNALRSFDAKDNNIAFNAAQLNLTGTMGDAGYAIKTLMGTDALATTSAGSGAADDFDLQEAYLTYTCPITHMGLKVGKFVTYNGIEVIESKDDPTISRGYLFGLAEPYTHTGAVLSHPLGSKFDVAAGVVNGWDIVSDNNKSKTLVAKISGNFGDALSFTLSGLHGSEQANTVFLSSAITNDGNNRSTIDLTGVTKIIPKLALWFQVNMGQEKKIFTDPVSGNLRLATWSGFGVQPVYTFTDKFSVGGRVEYFYDKEGVRTGTVPGLSTTNYSIAPAYKCTENTTVRAEYRADSANKPVWLDDNGVAKKSSSTASLEFILTF